MNRPTSKGMWNLAKGSPNQQAVLLPKTYSDHRPWGPPARPAHLSLWSQGPSPKPVCCWSSSKISPFSEISKHWCSPSGWSWNSPGPPGSTYCPGRNHGNPKPASGQHGEESHNHCRLNFHTLLGHSLAMSWLEPVNNTPQRVRFASRRHLAFEDTALEERRGLEVIGKGDPEKSPLQIT